MTIWMLKDSLRDTRVCLKIAKDGRDVYISYFLIFFVVFI